RMDVLFFSGRRRHTRFSRDWSSDVCSSHLLAGARERPERELRRLGQPPAHEVADLAVGELEREHAVVLPALPHPGERGADGRRRDRKSTRLNSSHVKISYAVFCLKKKKKYM